MILPMASGRRCRCHRLADEIGRLGRTLNDMLGRIGRAQAAQRDALEQQRRFLADASHQLRTPLAIIKAEVELAQSGTTKGDDLRATMASIGEETDRLSGLTEELLLLAAADEQRLTLNRESVKVRDLLTDVAERGPRSSPAGRANDHGSVRRQHDHGGPGAPGVCLGQPVDNALTHGAGNVELVGQREGSC